MTDGWLSLKILNLLASSLKRTPYFQRISLSVVATRLFFFFFWHSYPHKIGSFFVPHLTYIYTISVAKSLVIFFWETCVVKVASLNIFLLLFETKRSIPICSPWVPFDLGSLYCLFRRTFAHFTKMCIKKQGKAWAERRERERGKSHFLLALLIPICDSWNFQFFAWWSPSSWAFYQRESTLLSMLQWPHQF